MLKLLPILLPKTYKGKLHIESLSFAPYFNLIPNLSIVSIWSLTFQYHINLVPIIISWMKIDDMANGQNKILVYYHINESWFFIFAIRRIINLHPKNNNRD